MTLTHLLMVDTLEGADQTEQLFSLHRLITHGLRNEMESALRMSLLGGATRSMTSPGGKEILWQSANVMDFVIH